MARASRYISVTKEPEAEYCSGCGEKTEAVVRLQIGEGIPSMLCPGCRIKTEALLRGARKGMR